jgi:hypothetical protein
MKLPGKEKAVVAESKLKGYLLSETHSVGKAKAKFFVEVGFDQDTIEILELGLLAIAQSEEVTEVVPSPHGVKYVIDGRLETPNGQRVDVRTIWIIDRDGDRPRFVTAYPA